MLSLLARASYSKNFRMVSRDPKLGCDNVAHAACVSPSSAFLLELFRRLPCPSPVKGYRRATLCRVVAHKVHLRVLVNIRVGVELPRDKVFHISLRRRIDKGESVDLRV